jgi:hypothetical protein
LQEKHNKGKDPRKLLAMIFACKIEYRKKKDHLVLTPSNQKISIGITTEE